MTREIPLTRGYVALVDDEDYERVAAKKWTTLMPSSKGAARAVHYWREGKKVRAIGLGPFILGVASPLVVDHINGNPLDNRRCNLRPCTTSQNLKNRRQRKPSRTGFKGVYPIGRRFQAMIMTDGVRQSLGCFGTAEEAAEAYDVAATRLHGEFASLNFPVGVDSDVPSWVPADLRDDYRDLSAQYGEFVAASRVREMKREASAERAA